MKILLISLFRTSFIIPPLGILSIASFLKKNIPSLDVEIFDFQFDGDITNINDAKTDIYGISSGTIDYSFAIKVAKNIKKFNKNAITIIGGPHISAIPNTLDRVFDIGVIGEGELISLKLVNFFQKNSSLNKKNLRNIKGIVFWKGNKLFKTAPQDLIEDLNILPVNNLKLVKKNYFKKQRNDNIGGFVKHFSIITSRGCPFNCSFCNTPRFWGKGKVRFYPIEKTLDEIEFLYKSHRITHFTIWDDIFAINKERLKEFAKGLSNRNLLNKVSFFCHCRTNLFDEHTAKLLKKINVKGIYFGFESGNQRILNFLKGKNIKIENNRNAIEISLKYGFIINGGVIVGSPIETIPEMQETLDFVLWAFKKGIYRIMVFQLLPLPGTKIWDIAVKNGTINEKFIDWDVFAFVNFQKPFILNPDINKRDYLAFLNSKKMKKAQFLTRFNMSKSFFLNNMILFLIQILSSPIYHFKKLLFGLSRPFEEFKSKKRG